MEPIILDPEGQLLLRLMKDFTKARRWHPDKAPGRLRAVADIFAQERVAQLRERSVGGAEAVAEAEAILRDRENRTGDTPPAAE